MSRVRGLVRYVQESILCLEKAWPPDFIRRCGADAEVLHEEADHGFKGNAPGRKMNTLEGCTSW